jgi:hypothetical protein
MKASRFCMYIAARTPIPAMSGFAGRHRGMVESKRVGDDRT